MRPRIEINQNTFSQPEYDSVSEMSRSTGISVSTINNMIRDGRMPENLKRVRPIISANLVEHFEAYERRRKKAEEAAKAEEQEISTKQ